jgi:hypothetical protein
MKECFAILQNSELLLLFPDLVSCLLVFFFHVSSPFNLIDLI